MKSIFLLSLLLVNLACSPLYMPNRQNMPLLTKKNEFQGSVSYGVDGANVQGSYAFDEHFAGMINAEMGKNKATNFDGDPTGWNKQKFAEIGLGYFKPLGSNGAAEIFAGYGTGKSSVLEYSDYAANPDFRRNGTFQRFFIQPNVGFHSKVFEAGFGLRTVFVHYDRIVSSTSSHQGKSTFVLVEPAATLRLGWENVKLSWQMGLSLPAYNGSELDYNPLIGSFGVDFNFGK